MILDIWFAFLGLYLMQWDETITPDVTTMGRRIKINNQNNDIVNLYLNVYRKLRTISPAITSVFENRKMYVYTGNNQVSAIEQTVGDVINLLMKSLIVSPYEGQCLFWTSYFYTKGNLNQEMSNNSIILYRIFLQLKPLLSQSERFLIDNMQIDWKPINFIRAESTMNEDTISYEPVTNILLEEEEDSITYETD
jgi:hypothetical protein